MSWKQCVELGFPPVPGTILPFCTWYSHSRHQLYLPHTFLQYQTQHVFLHKKDTPQKRAVSLLLSLYEGEGQVMIIRWEFNQKELAYIPLIKGGKQVSRICTWYNSALLYLVHMVYSNLW
jgi:hypothetical protein